MTPLNKFDGFFDNKDTPIPFTPTMEQCIEAVMTIILQKPDWFKIPEIRLVVAKSADGLALRMLEEKEKGNKPDLHIGYAAFMMMVTEVLDITFDDYATPEEREARQENEDEEADPFD